MKDNENSNKEAKVYLFDKFYKMGAEAKDELSRSVDRAKIKNSINVEFVRLQELHVNASRDLLESYHSLEKYSINNVLKARLALNNIVQQSKETAKEYFSLFGEELPQKALEDFTI